MAIQLVIGNKVTFKVEGSYNDEAGKKVPFGFSLTCKRKTVDELQSINEQEFFSEKNAVQSFMADVVTGWSGVKDDGGAEVEFSTDALHQLFQIPGVAGLAFAAYMSECGAKAKN